MDFVYWLEIENYFLNIIWVGHINSVLWKCQLENLCSRDIDPLHDMGKYHGNADHEALQSITDTLKKEKRSTEIYRVKQKTGYKNNEELFYLEKQLCSVERNRSSGSGKKASQKKKKKKKICELKSHP